MLRLGVGQPSCFAGDGGKQRTELDALRRSSDRFQNVTDFGLGTVAMKGCAHAKRTVHFQGFVSCVWSL